MRNADILADAAQHAFLSACSAQAAWWPSGSSTAPAGGDRGGPHGSLAAARAGSSGRGTPGLGCTQHPPPPGEMSRGRTGKGQEVRLGAAGGVRGERLFRGSSSGHGQATGHQCLQEVPCVCPGQNVPGWAAGDGGVGGVLCPHRAWLRGGVQKILDPP